MKKFKKIRGRIPYGKETIIDLENCDVRSFTRHALKVFFRGICDITKMQAEKQCWWDDYGVRREFQQTKKHTKGTTASHIEVDKQIVTQFILTSNITVHTLSMTGKVLINFFSCKDYDQKKVREYVKWFFEGKVIQCKTTWRF